MGLNQSDSVMSGLSYFLLMKANEGFVICFVVSVLYKTGSRRFMWDRCFYCLALSPDMPGQRLVVIEQFSM